MRLSFLSAPIGQSSVGTQDPDRKGGRNASAYTPPRGGVVAARAHHDSIIISIFIYLYKRYFSSRLCTGKLHVSGLVLSQVSYFTFRDLFSTDCIVCIGSACNRERNAANNIR